MNAAQDGQALQQGAGHTAALGAAHPTHPVARSRLQLPADVLIIVAVVLLKFAIGIVAGFFALLLYVAIGVVLIAAVIWAVRAL